LSPADAQSAHLDQKEKGKGKEEETERKEKEKRGEERKGKEGRKERGTRSPFSLPAKDSPAILPSSPSKPSRLDSPTNNNRL